jgi:two-component system, chemotaxis family, response regulator Rcp1
VRPQRELVAPLTVLLVEDNPADVRLLCETLKDGHVYVDFEVARDGIEALQILEATRADNLPDLILLDLNLPRKNGFEVLEEIKRNELLRHIPIVILTTSDAAKDRIRCTEFEAAAFITKPVELGEFIDTVRTVDDFWLAVVPRPAGKDND